MIRTLVTCLLLLSSARAFSQSQFAIAANTPRVVNFQSQSLDASLDGYRTMYKIPGERMKRWGTTLTIMGGGLIIGGIVVAASADPNYSSYNSYSQSYDTTDPKSVLGIVMIVYGVGLSVPGILLWTKGVKRYNEYFEQQRKLSLNLKGSGLSLRYSL